MKIEKNTITRNLIIMCAKKSSEHPSKEEAESEGEEKELTEEELKEKKLESHRKAGKIAKEALQKAADMTKPGVKVMDLITEIEQFIIDQDGQIGFPMNVSINNVAAHYTSGMRDTTEIENGMVVKLDLGVHVEGFIADTATTVNLSDDPDLENIFTAAKESMEAGIDMIKVGTKTNEIGKKIYEIIKSYKYNPIKDLSGHTVEQWMVHGGKQIPLIPKPKGDTIEEGDVFAVETFASTGEGQTHAMHYGNIYQLIVNRVPKIRNKSAKKLIGFIAKYYKTLPFCQRSWMKELAVPRFAINDLINTGVLLEYKVLSDIKGSFVAQSEKTVFVHEDHIEILT